MSAVDLARVCGELKGFLEAKGFVVQMDASTHGFPLVQRPFRIADTIDLMRLDLPWPCERRIYEEGMMIIPIPPRRPAPDDTPRPATET